MPEPEQLGSGTDLLTLRLDITSQSHFDSMRQQYFPADRNLIAAHLTLFHVLPQTDAVTATLAAAAAETKPFTLQVTGLRSLGRGVAYKLEAPEILILRRTLAVAFASELSAQDQQKFQPHVVIQNKVTSVRAKQLMELLSASFRGFDVQAVGLDLWHYLGGPWEHARTFPFSER